MISGVGVPIEPLNNVVRIGPVARKKEVRFSRDDGGRRPPQRREKKEDGGDEPRGGRKIDITV